jgi:hypothetical protein
MTSFIVEIEPAAAPRLACLALIVHLAAAASPWLAHLRRGSAVMLTAAALASLVSSIAAVTGPHQRVKALRIDAAGCRVRMRGSREWQAATLGPGSRVFANLAFLDIRTREGRRPWLLTRSAAPSGSFRRLKARVRLSC